jgi:GT2 family glycosyltransferase
MAIGSGDNDKIDKVLRTIIRYFKYKPLRVLRAYGICIAIRKDLLNKIGGFNELFRFSCEELTLCIPANALGYKVVVVPKAIIRHKSSATINTLRLDYEFIVNRFLYILLYYPFPMLIKSLLGRLILELLHPSSYYYMLKALLKLLKMSRLILFQRKITYKLTYNDFFIKSPINLTKNAYIELTLKKLLEVNKLE